jgi:hypothetical protein
MAAEDWDDVIDFVLSRTLCKLGLHFFEMDKIYRPEVKDCRRGVFGVIVVRDIEMSLYLKDEIGSVAQMVRAHERRM